MVTKYLALMKLILALKSYQKKGIFIDEFDTVQFIFTYMNFK